MLFSVQASTTSRKESKSKLQAAAAAAADELGNSSASLLANLRVIHKSSHDHSDENDREGKSKI